MAHITGGGIIDNLKRVLSKNYGFIINKRVGVCEKIIFISGLKMIAGN